MLQEIKTNLEQEVEYLKHASIELQTLNEELTLVELFGYSIDNSELIKLVEDNYFKDELDDYYLGGEY